MHWLPQSLGLRGQTALEPRAKVLPSPLASASLWELALPSPSDTRVSPVQSSSTFLVEVTMHALTDPALLVDLALVVQLLPQGTFLFDLHIEAAANV